MEAGDINRAILRCVQVHHPTHQSGLEAIPCPSQVTFDVARPLPAASGGVRAAVLVGMLDTIAQWVRSASRVSGPCTVQNFNE